MAQSKPPRKYSQWTREFYDSSTGLSSNTVHVLEHVRNQIWAGTESGISIMEKGVWKSRIGKGWPTGKVDFLCKYDNQVLATANGQLHIHADGKWMVPEGPKTALKADVDPSGKLWLCSTDGLWTYDGSQWTHAKRMGMMGMRFGDFKCLPEGNALAVVATSRGLFFLQGKRLYWFGVQAKEEGLLSNDTRCARPDGSGHIWVATDKGLSIYAGGNGWCSIRGEEGLPYEDLKQLELTSWGDYWIGTDMGLILLKEGRWKYFASKRWLPSDRITDILPVKEGEVWVSTDEGISHLSAKQMSLEEKASHYEETVRKYHTRMGYVTRRSLSVPGDLSSGSVSISDNDGLWTGIYIASEAFRYAVTGDSAAKKCARESLNALFRLEEVTGVPGFPARAIRGEGDPGFGNGHPEWHRTSDGMWEWKGETSSDEIDGHYFGMSIYLDLVGGMKDRERIIGYTRRLTDHIIDNDYHLVDKDGKPTTWGVWSPKKLNQDDRWRMQRGLNSLEILSYLRTAHHITGEETYLSEYHTIVSKHHYALNTVKQRQTVLDQQIWHDDRLAYLAYYPLLKYEEDPALRQVYLLSLERTWGQIRGQRNSLWNIMTSAMTGQPHDVDAAVNTLAEYPLDLICWTVKNSHRTDITLDPKHPNQATEPLPADERRISEWAASLHDLDGGRDGMSAMDGTWYLLPYWMGRYHGFIE